MALQRFLLLRTDPNSNVQEVTDFSACSPVFPPSLFRQNFEVWMATGRFLGE